MLDYVNLVAQGRAKDIGIPWTPEENDLLHQIVRERGINRVTVASYMRKSKIDSMEDFDKVIAKGEKPKERKELEEDAKKAGIPVDEGASDTTLEAHIEKAKSKKKDK